MYGSERDGSGMHLRGRGLKEGLQKWSQRRLLRYKMKKKLLVSHSRGGGGAIGKEQTSTPKRQTG